MRRVRRTAFTLIELLVVIAIIAVLVALLLPAVQQAREAARRSQCRNNLKQIGLGLQNYHSNYNVFPIGYLDVVAGGTERTSSGWAWTAYLLPFIDQEPLYSQFNFDATPYALTTVGGVPVLNQSLVQTVLSGFSCPSDSRPATNANNASDAPTGGGTAAIALCNYMGVGGPFEGAPCADSGTTVILDARNIGMLRVNSAVRMTDITDGSSNVFAVGECRYITNRLDIAGIAIGSERIFLYGSVSTNGGAHCPNASHNGNGAFPHLRFTRSKMNAPLLSTSQIHKSFSSLHVGGAHFVMGDGSVRFVSENIDHTDTNFIGSNLNGPYGIYQRLGGINDGQEIGEF